MCIRDRCRRALCLVLCVCLCLFGASCGGGRQQETAYSRDFLGKLSPEEFMFYVIETFYTLLPHLDSPAAVSYTHLGASSIQKEWNEQAEAFAQWCIGKTVDEVKNIPLKDGVPNTIDLVTSVTIHVTDFVTAVEKAVNNAE